MHFLRQLEKEADMEAGRVLTEVLLLSGLLAAAWDFAEAGAD